MAISFVESGSGILERLDGTSPTRTLNFAGTLEEDDIVIAGATMDYRGAPGVPAPSTSGYTELAADTDTGYGGNAPTFGVHWKRMGSTPDTSIAFDGNQTANVGGCCGYLVLRGCSTDADPFIASPVAANGASGNPDPGSLSGFSDGDWSIIWGFLDDDPVTASGAPTNWTNLLAQAGDGPNGTTASLMAATRAISSAGAYNPGTFTTSGNDQWNAVHLGIAPAASGVITPAVARHHARHINKAA